MVITDKWTQFTKEIIESVEKVDTSYPVRVDSTTGEVTLIEVKEKSTENIDLNLKGEGIELALKAILGKYEWEEELPNKQIRKRTVTLPKLPNGNLADLFKDTAKLMKLAEAFRKFAIIQLMARPEVQALNLQGTGVLLADQLINEDGINKDIDKILKKTYGAETSLNSILANYNNEKFAMVNKDKLLSKTNNNFTEALEFIAGLLENSNVVTNVTLEKTGVNPTLVKQTDDVIRPITSIGNKNNRGFKSLI